MPYKLKKGVYAVRCRHPHCPFNERIEILENIMGVTESDVRWEALKMARDAACVKHDSIYGRKHVLENPEVRMAGGSCVAVGITAPTATPAPRGVDIRRYDKGDVIMKEGADATIVCEVLEGLAFPARNKAHRYTPGDCFGWAPFLPNHGMSDVIAAMDRTSVAFYDLAQLRRSDPNSASTLLARAMEDSLRVIGELGRTVARLRRVMQRAAV
jgi:hypothetical protein